MSTSATGKRPAIATAVKVDADVLHVTLSDGRELRVPIAEFEFLREASSEQRAGGVPIANGTALWWEELEDGISVAGLIGVSETELERFAGLDA